MALKAIITAEEHQSLGDILKTEYVEKDGRYFLDVETVDGLGVEDVGGLRKALQKERQDKEDATKKLEEFADLGDPDDARAAIARASEMATWTPEEKVSELITARENKITEKFTSDIQAKDAEIGELRTSLHKQVVNAAAAAAIAKHGGSVQLLRPHVQSKVQVVKDAVTGEYVPRVLDSDGKPGRITERSGGGTDYMTVEELVGLMAKEAEYSAAFPQASGSGGGRNTSSHSGGRIDPSLPAEQRLAMARERKSQ